MDIKTIIILLLIFALAIAIEQLTKKADNNNIKIKNNFFIFISIYIISPEIFSKICYNIDGVYNYDKL